MYASLLFLLLVTHASCAQPIRVLFIGNSLTARNDLPGMVSRLIGTKVRSLTVPGASLTVHAANPATRSVIREGRWTHVVLQEQSEKLSYDPAYATTHVWPAARVLANDAGNATVVWYETPAHRGGNRIGDSFQAMQRRVTAGYVTLNDAVGHVSSRIAPVGTAFGVGLNRTASLYTDSVHPNTAGTYLASLVFYRTITGKLASKTTWRPRGVPKSFVDKAKRWADSPTVFPPPVANHIS